MNRSLMKLGLVLLVVLVAFGLTHGQRIPETIFSVVATNSVQFKSGCTVESGHVAVTQVTPGPHVSGLAQLDIGEYVYGASASNFIADTIYIQNGSNIAAAFYNGLTNYGVIRDFEQSPYTFPFPIPLGIIPPPTVGTQDIEVLPYTNHILEPGQYNKITVYDGANLIFTGGQYEIETLYVPGDYCGLFFRGAATVNINSRFITDVGMTLGPDNDTVRPDQIKIFSHYTSPEPLGKEAVRFGQYSLVKAIVKAPNGTIKVKTGCTLEGRFFAKDLYIWSYVLIRLPL